MTPPSPTPPTLQDVADLAGVSTATVSRCLNAPDRVVEKTRTKVMNAVKALDYTPNFAARVMAAKRSYTIGAIIPTMENAIFARGLQAFQEALSAKGYTLLVASSAYRPETEEEQVRKMVARGADGLLLIGHDRHASVYDYLERHQLPAVAAWSHAEDARLPSVGFDNAAAMRAMTQAVLDQGHRRLAMVSGISAGNDRAAGRIAGFRAAVAAAGLSEMPLIETPYGIEAGAEALGQLMALPERPTAVLCGNDVLAVGVLIEAERRGLRVPEDLSVTGFDDIELAHIARPALTTVHVPHRDMGQRAGEVLMGMIEDQAMVRPAPLETRIVMRGSLGRLSTVS